MRPFWARVVAVGTPVTTALAAPMGASDLVLSVASLTPASATPPAVPFGITVGQESMVVTAVAGSVWSVPGRDTTQSTAHAKGDAVGVIGAPVAFVEQLQQTPGVFGDHPGGRYGTCDGATISASDAALFQSIDASLVQTSVDPSDGETTYTLVGTNSPAYEVNASTVAVGKMIQPWLHSSQEYYLFSLAAPAPFWARLTSSTQSQASTVLSGSIDNQQTNIPITPILSSALAQFPSEGTWTATLDSGGAAENVRVNSMSADGSQLFVTRGVDNTAAVAHPSGVSVAQNQLSYGFVELTQVLRGVFLGKVGGRTSDSDPTVAANQPAYPTRPGATVLLNTPYLLWPGPLTSRNYWLFEAEIPAAQGVAGIVDLTTDQVLGMGRKAVHGLRIMPQTEVGINNVNDAIFDQSGTTLTLTGAAVLALVGLLATNGDVHIVDQGQGNAFVHETGSPSTIHRGITQVVSAPVGQAITGLSISGGIIWAVTTSTVAVALAYGTF